VCNSDTVKVIQTHPRAEHTCMLRSTKEIMMAASGKAEASAHGRAALCMRANGMMTRDMVRAS
jgi:predicted nuclease with RNAse H fold